PLCRRGPAFPTRRSSDLGAVADHDELDLGAALGQHAVDGPVDLGRAVAHGQDHARNGGTHSLRHLSRRDATMAARCATVITAPRSEEHTSGTPVTVKSRM